MTQEPDWETLGMPHLPKGYERLGIGVIGAGAIVQAAHLPAYASLGLPVQGIFDLDRERALAAGRRFGLPRVYESVEALLDDPGVAIVDIAVPPQHLPLLLRQALLAGKHVLCQKPAARTPAELQALVSLVGAFKDQKVAVNQQMRWAPVIRALKWALEGGLLGTPEAVSIDVSVSTDWTQWPWILDEPYLLSLFNTIHLIDSFRACFGTPTRVDARASSRRQARPRGETDLLLVLDGAGPAIATIHDRHDNVSPDRHAWIRVEGTEGVAQGTIGIWTNYPRGEPDGFRWWSRRDPGEVRQAAIRQVWVPDAFRGPMVDLMGAVLEDRQPTTSLDDNQWTLATCFAAVRSLREGGPAPVRLPHADEERRT
jgi:predicted dehydrogenase